MHVNIARPESWNQSIRSKYIDSKIPVLLVDLIDQNPGIVLYIKPPSLKSSTSLLNLHNSLANVTYVIRQRFKMCQNWFRMQFFFSPVELLGRHEYVEVFVVGYPSNISSLTKMRVFTIRQPTAQKKGKLTDKNWKHCQKRRTAQDQMTNAQIAASMVNDVEHSLLTPAFELQANLSSQKSLKTAIIWITQ